MTADPTALAREALERADKEMERQGYLPSAAGRQGIVRALAALSAPSPAERIVELEREVERLLNDLQRVRGSNERLDKTLGEIEAENLRLRAALANSKDPCIYCQLPAEEMALCKAGFPGCSRADDISGCPEFGSMMNEHHLQEELSAAEATIATMREALEPLRPLSEKATAGPWSHSEKPSYFSVHGEPRRFAKPRLIAACAKPHVTAEADARFIAAAVNFVRAALAAAEAVGREQGASCGPEGLA